jgi:hypothetical protein
MPCLSSLGVGVFIRHAREGRHPVHFLAKFSGFPFDFAQGGESCDVAQDREPVERPVEPLPSQE